MFRSRLACGLFVALSLAAAAPASAQGAVAVPVGGGGSIPAPQIMVVDADRILQQCKASRALQGQIEAQQQAYQKEFAQKQTDLETEQSTLARDQHSMPADQFEEKRHAFNKRIDEVQHEVDAKKRALSQGAGQAIDKVKGELVQIVQSIAQERRANLVLLRSQLVLFDPTYDATDEALRRLDQRITSVPLVLASGQTSTPAPKKK